MSQPKRKRIIVYSESESESETVSVNEPNKYNLRKRSPLLSRNNEHEEIVQKRKYTRLVDDEDIQLPVLSDSDSSVVKPTKKKRGVVAKVLEVPKHRLDEEPSHNVMYENLESDDESDDAESESESESESDEDESDEDDEDESESADAESDAESESADAESDAAAYNVFKKAVLTVLKDHSSVDVKKNVIDKWLHKIPEDQREVLTPVADKLYTKLARLPNYADIISSKMSFNDKYSALTKLESINNDQMRVDEFLCAKDDLLKSLDEYKKINATREELEEMERMYSVSKSVVDEPLKMKILNSNVSESNKKVLLNKAHRLATLSSDDDTKPKLQEWIDWGLKISNKLTPLPITYVEGPLAINKYLFNVKQYMDKHLYGLNKAKERLLELLVTRITNPMAKDISLALVGPPGVGKTELVRVFAEAIKQPFMKINMGGSTDPNHYLGHSFTYTGAMPGTIFKALTTFKDSAGVRTKSGIMFFDEFDKIGINSRVGHTFLHISDPTQQSDFQDHYMAELTIDLSNIMFVYSLNHKDNIDKVLLDRLPVIELEGYDSKDKREIIINYVLPMALKNIGLGVNDISISADGISAIISAVDSNDKGIRRIKQFTQAIINKINALHCSTHADGASIFSYHTKPVVYPFVIDTDIVRKFEKEVIDRPVLSESVYSMYM